MSQGRLVRRCHSAGEGLSAGVGMEDGEDSLCSQEAVSRDTGRAGGDKMKKALGCEDQRSWG